MNGNNNPLAKILAILITTYPDHAEELGRITNLFLKDPEKAKLELYKWEKSSNIKLPDHITLLIEQELQQGKEVSSRDNNENQKKKNSKDSKNQPYNDGAYIAKDPTPAERYRKAIVNKFIRKQSNERTSKDYLEEKTVSEKDVFDKWYEENTRLGKTKFSEEEVKAYKESEEFKKKLISIVDEKYKKKFEGEIAAFIIAEKSRIYENPNEDPVIKEYKKILAEANKKSPEEAEKIKKEASKILHEEFTQKTLSYSKDLPEIKEYLIKVNKEILVAPSIIMPSSVFEEESYSSEPFENDNNNEEVFPYFQGNQSEPENEPDKSGNQSSSNRPSRPNRRTIREINPEKNVARRAAGRTRGKGQKALLRFGRVAVQVVSKIPPHVWIVIIALIILVILIFMLFGLFDDPLENGGVYNISKSADKEAVANPPDDLNYLTALSTPQDITYTITVSYSGKAQSVTVTDPIPENAILVSADNDAEFLDENGNIITDKNLARTVTWTITPEASSGGNLSNPANTTLGDWLNKKLSENPLRLGLSGMGPTIANLSAKYNVPIELALGQFALETQWYSDKGVTVTQGSNNPGNILCNPDLRLGAIGNDIVDRLGTHYCRFSSLESGLEAYFKHLDSSTYRSAVDEFIKTSNPRPVIHIYYSSSNDPSSGNENSYVNTVNNITKDLRDAAVIDGVNLAVSSSFNEQYNNATSSFTLALRPKPGAKDTYIINQAFASGAGISICTGGSTVVLDPGHPSEVGIGGAGNGVNEVEKVLEIANIIKPKLEAKGYSVILTRNNNTTRVTNKARAETANSANASLMFRIHTDAGRTDRGVAYYYPAEQGTVDGVTGPSSEVIEKSKQAATAILNTTRDTLIGNDMPLFRGGLLTDADTAVGKKNGGALAGSIYSSVPTVLVELGSLTNATDATWLKSTDNLNKYADSLASGISNFAGTSTCADSNNDFPTNYVGTGGYTPLQGQWEGTTQKLTDYLLANNPSPKFTVSTLTLAGYYIKYAAEVNLRADILWAQMIHETGFGKYGGDVLPSQNNFAGVGATGNGEEGISFVTAEAGVKAQIAHMAAYVYTTDITSWTNSQTDPRYDLIIPRGIAKSLNNLDGRWAIPGNGYGTTIENYVRIINQ
ncbi:MAG: N-acetylmuramoyl-L-alanine amidase [Candidatus Levyibacteriota bacterium]